MTKNEINEKIIELKKWEKDLKQTKSIVEALKEELKDELESRGVEELETDMFTVFYQKIVSDKFDTTRFKQENSVLYNYYLKENVTKRFSVH